MDTERREKVRKSANGNWMSTTSGTLIIRDRPRSCATPNASSNFRIRQYSMYRYGIH